MFNYFKNCVTSKYMAFKGRARRSEYWYFNLFCMIIFFAIVFISIVLPISSAEVSLITFVFYIAIIIPTLAVTWRRMHDVGKSGWFSFIPIYNLVLACTDSQIGENEYGPNPKGIGNNKSTDDLINSIGNQQ